MIRPRLAPLVLGLLVWTASAGLSAEAQKAQPKAAKPTLPAKWIEAFQWRSIGPANMSGRITSLAVYEKDPKIWWAATASGGLLKTTNNGTTFEHQFDRQATVSIGDVQVARSDPNIVWVGTGEGNPRNSSSWGDGVYKSTDGGKTWKNMGLKKIFQTGRLAIHPKDPNIVYVGALGRLWGPNEERGLYKTTDGGKTWNKILYIDDKTGIIDVQMHPKEPDTLLVASYERQRDGFDSNDPAKKYGAGSGLHKTTDGGKTFKKLTEGLPTCKLGRIGISYYRRDPKLVYIVLESEKIGQEPPDAPYMGITGSDAEVGARITEVTKGGPAEKAGLKKGDIVVSIDGKTVYTYTDFLREVRQRVAGDKAKLEVSRDHKGMEVEITFRKKPRPKKEESSERGRSSRQRTAFSGSLGGQRENLHDQQGKQGQDYGGIYRSEDGGETWTRINSVNPRPMYYSQIRVDPRDNNHIFVLGTSLYRSVDGGKKFTADGAGGGVHTDHHAMWIDPRDGRHIILGNDGGIYVTYDRAKNWDHHNHVAIGQFYHVTVGPRRDYRVYGGLQDNGSWGGPNHVRYGAGPVNTDWVRIGGGDGFICLVDPGDPDEIYMESQNGAMGRINLRTGERGSARPRPPKDVRYRFNWKTPFLLSHHNPSIHYSAGNHVFRSIKKGSGAKAISPEITNTDRGSGSALAESPLDEDVLYVGTTDGAFWMTRSGGKEWIDLFADPPKEEKPKEEKTKEEKDAEKKQAEKDSQPQQTEEKPKEEKPQADPEPKQDAKADASDPIGGTWTGKIIADNVPPERAEFTLALRMAADGKVTGSYKSASSEGEFFEGKFDAKNAKLEAAAELGQSKVRLQGTISGKKLSGTIVVNEGEFSLPFEARRTAEAAQPASEAQAEEKPKEEPKPSPEAKPQEKTDEKPSDKKPDAKPEPDDGSKPIKDLIPGPRWVSSLETSRAQPGRAYVTFDGHRSNDDQPYVFVTENYGRTWRSIRANLPDSCGSTRVIREDVENRNVLYLGTEFAAWVSVDRGASWTRLNGNLPTVAVHEFAIHPTAGEIVAGTHGRSLWVLDVTALRQMSAETIQADVHLYRPNDVVRWHYQPRRGSSGTRRFVGQNPPSGAHIYYSLAKDAGKVTLTVSDIQGRTLRELQTTNKAGLHVARWDLRRATGAAQTARSRSGSSVRPGSYLVTLTVDDKESRQPLTVLADPDYPESTMSREEARQWEALFGEEEEADPGDGRQTTP